MLIVNDIPLIALIIESFVSVFTFTVASLTIRIWFKRKKEATLFLSLSMYFYAIAVLLINLGHYLDFFSNLYPEVTYADAGLTLAFSLFVLANVFTFLFISEVFLSEVTSSLSLSLMALVHGIVIGILLSNLSTEPESFESNLYFLIVGVLLIVFVNSLLIYFSAVEIRKNEDKLPKIGFSLILLFGVFIISLFVLIVFDVLAPEPFSIFYYLTMLSAALANLLGYLGYLMPNWFKNLFR